MIENWYVYRHIRSDKNEPFYIGIGNQVDFKRAFEKIKRNIIWTRIIHKTEYKVEILFTDLTKEKASEKEKEFIRLYGRKDLETGTLCNMTDGGDGVLNKKWTEKQRHKASIDKIGNKNPQFGKKQSKETLEKRSLKLKGKLHSKERKQLHSLATIGGQAKEVEVYLYKEDVYIGTYHSVCEACRQLGNYNMNSKAVMVANGKRNHTKGYVFKYTGK